MQVKIYFNRQFPMSLFMSTDIDITIHLEYVGSIECNYNKDVQNVLQIVFEKLQLNEENLEITLPRSLSVGDVLNIENSFYLIENTGFKKL